MPKKTTLPITAEQVPAIFEDTALRRVMHDGEWHFAAVDVVAALTDSTNPTDYLKKLRKRDPGLAVFWRQSVPRKPMPTLGGTRMTNCTTAEGIFRLIQSIPSPKVEPFKQWLAKVAVERITEEINPDLAVDRAVTTMVRKGKTRQQASARVVGRVFRNDLTDEYSRRDVKLWYDFKNLTHAFYQAAFGMTAAKLCIAMGVEDNPRDHMQPLVLTAVSLGEQAVIAEAERTDAQGYRALKVCAIFGGKVTRRALEHIQQPHLVLIKAA
jgi:prophage antirepressor-like protein